MDTKEYLENVLETYADFEEMCVRRSNECRGYLHDCADQASASTLLVLASQIEAYDSMSLAAAEKSKSLKGLLV